MSFTDGDENSAQDITKAPDIGWPKWSWSDSGWWLGAADTIGALILFVSPALSKYPLPQRLLVVLAFVTAIPPFCLFVLFCSRCLVRAWQKLHWYDAVHYVVRRQSEELKQAQGMVLDLTQKLANARRFEIEKVLYYDEHLYIVCLKKRGFKLNIGDKLTVIDTRDGFVMGIFEVTEIRASEYRVSNIDYISPMWMGYVRQTGGAESSAPPHTVAIHIPKETDDAST